MMTSDRRTDFAAFVLDLLDFMEENSSAKPSTTESRAGAIAEAAGAVPLLRDRLTENEVVQTGFMLVLDVELFEPHAAAWWADFGRMDRAEFENEARLLVGPEGRLAALRKLVNQPGPAEADPTP